MRLAARLINILLFWKRKEKDGFYHFEIKKGAHRSCAAIRYTESKSIEFEATFDDTFEYKTDDPQNQEDVNKLFGISDGFSHIRNSARIGWRCLDGRLEILAYTHFDGVFEFQKICDAKPGESILCRIDLADGGYAFSAGGKTICMRRHPKKSGMNYYLWPYFGGDEAAPRSISIKIRPLKGW